MASTSGTASESTTKTKRAGLVMPVSRIERNLRKGRYAERIGSGGSVYLAAVLEYLSAEMLELAGNAAAQNKKHRIAPRHIMLAIEHDEEFKKLMKGVLIPEAGVIPGIHPALLKTQSDKKRSAKVNPNMASQEI